MAAPAPQCRGGPPTYTALPTQTRRATFQPALDARCALSTFHRLSSELRLLGFADYDSRTDREIPVATLDPTS